jgi:PleD family two-component response regulator
MEAEFFRSLLDEFYDGVYFVDRYRVITYWNAAAERLGQLVRSSRLDLSGGSLSVTVSIGAAVARREEQPLDTVRRADQLMFSSKRAGRDRVTVDVDP